MDTLRVIWRNKKRKQCPCAIWNIATRKLDHLDSVQYIEELRIPPGNMLETLKGDRKGQYSIRTNNIVSVSNGYQKGQARLKLLIIINPNRGKYYVRVPTHREPTHPGEMLIEEFLVPMGLTQRELANSIHVPYQRINEIINKKRGITPSTALRLAKFFGMSEDFWMNLQLRWDLYKVKRQEAKELKAIRPFRLSEKVVHS